MLRPLFLSVLCALGGALVGCGGGATEGGGGGAETSGGESATVSDEARGAFERGVRAMAERGRPAARRARDAFEEALTLEPTFWEARYNLGVLERREGDLNAAATSFEAARLLAPSSPDVLTALAEVRWALGEHDTAAGLLQTYVGEHPDEISARVELATMLRELRNFDGALAQAREVLIRDPRNAIALAEVGRVYRAREQYDVAELVFRKALELGETAALHNDLGLLELARGDTQAAFEQFRAAIALDAAFAPAHINQGAVLLRAGDYPGAETEYRAVLEHDEDNLDARVALGVCLRGRGEHRDARREYEHVLEAQPNHAAALFNLGVLLAEFLDDRPGALERFRRYLELAPGGAPEREMAERYVRDIGGELAPPPPSEPTPES